MTADTPGLGQRPGPDHTGIGISTPASFSPGSIPRRQHLEVWRRACGDSCSITPLTDDWHFTGTVCFWFAGEMLLTHHNMTATRYERSHGHIRRNPMSWVLLRFVLSGTSEIVIDGREHVTSNAGNIVVQDWSVPYSEVSSDHESVSVAIPRHLVSAADLMSYATPAILWATDSAQGDVLTAALNSLRSTQHRAQEEETLALASGFIGLVDGLLHAEEALLRNRYADTSRATAMKRFISENLRDPELGVRTLCERFHCSRATVYRMFEDTGGVASYMQRQRLTACMRELTLIQNPPKGVLEQVANAWGFSNTHRFSRLFKAQFNLSPQEALRVQMPVPEKQPGRSRGNHWDNADRLQAWLAGASSSEA